jgi:hypothetical protein
MNGRSGGSVVAHRSCARGQRVRNRQPLGGARADGSSPWDPSHAEPTREPVSSSRQIRFHGPDNEFGHRRSIRLSGLRDDFGQRPQSCLSATVKAGFVRERAAAAAR